MTIKSMTGFARADGSAGSTSWHWELRSVNGRGLDLRLRLPPGFEALEPRIREAASKRLTRGSLSINLNVKRNEGVSQIRLNEPALRQVLAALDKLQAMAKVEVPRADGLLGIRGVLEFVEAEEGEDAARARAEAMLVSLGQALDGLVAARAGEGRRLEAVIVDQLVAIEKLVETVQRSPARSPEAIRQRLKEQVARLLEPGVPLDETRLYQEAALLATRADVEEELKRLTAHIAGARELLGSSEQAGRRLDFLAQEFNREANTLCSKANDAETTRAGLELKAIIDQMREQVQNIE
ncbi:MAG: YicC/YloC family endoribonuclease [Hyphomicrobiaceae bacterium]